MIAEESNTSVLRAALTKVVGGEWKIGVAGADAGAAAAPSAAAEPEPDPRDEDDDEPAPPPAPTDPEADAMRLLRDQLGATPIEG
jgi:hypothetical protein